MENASFLYSLYQKIATAKENNDTPDNSSTLLEDVYRDIRLNSRKIESDLDELRELSGRV
jgi:hypothetical protein